MFSPSQCDLHNSVDALSETGAAYKSLAHCGFPTITLIAPVGFVQLAALDFVELAAVDFPLAH